MKLFSLKFEVLIAVKIYNFTKKDKDTMFLLNVANTYMSIWHYNPKHHH
jgi:hypothetical protein